MRSAFSLLAFARCKKKKHGLPEFILTSPTEAAAAACSCTFPMDIDDILREVDPSFDPIGGTEIQDLQALTRAWVAERSAPELLP